MAAQTIFNTIITWADHDQPGAGAQNADSAGINGNWWKIGSFLNFLFNLPSLSLKNAIIGALHLKTDVTDNTTLTQDGTTNKIKAKDGGIGATQLADASVTGPKISHENTRTKHFFNFRAFYTSGAWRVYSEGADLSVLTNLGVPMTRAGIVTGISFALSNNTSVVSTQAYAASGALIGRFAAGDRIAVAVGQGSSPLYTITTYLYVNGASQSSYPATMLNNAGGGVDGIITIEVEFD